jgi:hypothetical protein
VWQVQERRSVRSERGIEIVNGEEHGKNRQRDAYWEELVSSIHVSGKKRRSQVARPHAPIWFFTTHWRKLVCFFVERPPSPEAETQTLTSVTELDAIASGDGPPAARRETAFPWLSIRSRRLGTKSMGRQRDREKPQGCK